MSGYKLIFYSNDFNTSRTNAFTSNSSPSVCVITDRNPVPRSVSSQTEIKQRFKCLLWVFCVGHITDWIKRSFVVVCDDTDHGLGLGYKIK